MPPRRGRKRKASADAADTPCIIVDTLETADVPEWFRRSNVNSLVKRKITTLFPGDSNLAENKEFQERYLEYFYKLYTEKPTSRRHPHLRLSELCFRQPPMSREDIRHCFLNNIYMLECRVDMTKRNLYLKCEKHSYMNFMNKYESFRNAKAFPSFRRLSHRTMKYVNKYMSKFLKYLDNLEEEGRLKDQENTSTESLAENVTAGKSSAAPRSVKLRRLQEEKEKQKALDESENCVLAGPKKRVRFLESDEEDSDELRESAVAALYNLDGMPPEFREECEKILRDADDATESASKPGPSRIKSSAAPLSVKLQRLEQEQRKNLSAQPKKSVESHPESEEAFTKYDQAAVDALYNEVYDLGDSEILAELEKIDCQTPQKTVPLEMNKKKSQPRSRAIDHEKENRTMDMSDSEDDFVFCNLPKKRKNLKNISNIAPPPKKKPPVTIKKPKAAPLSVKRQWEATNKDTQSGNQSQNALSQKSNSSEINDNDGNNNSVSMDISCISDDGFHLNLHTARENNEDLLGSIPLTGQGLSQEVPEGFISSTPNFRPDILTVRLNDDRLLNIIRIHRDIRSYIEGGTDRIEENSVNESDTSTPSSCDREPIEISGSSARNDKDKTTQDLLESSNDSSDTESDTNQDEDNSSNTIVLVNLREEFQICFEDWGEYLFANFKQLMNTFVSQNLLEDDDDVVEAISDNFPPRTELVCVEDLSQRMSQLNNAQDPLYFTQ